MRTTKTLTPLLLVCLLFAVGCAESKKIPLFNPDARPLNRIYSAKELITELNDQASDMVLNGILSQEFVNKSVGPVLDEARKTNDLSEKLYKAGNVQDAKTKLETVKVALKSLRDTLNRIERKTS